MLPRPVEVEARPFYAFVFSPTLRGVRELQERLQARFREMSAIVLSADALGADVDSQYRPRETYLPVKPPAKGFYWQMFNEKLFSQREPPTLVYTVRPKLAADYPVGAVKVDADADYYRWERSGFGRIDGGAPAGFKVTVEPAQPAPQAQADGAGDGAADVRLTVSLQPDRSSDFSFYHLKLSLSPKELRPDILALSTRDDRNPNDADKTYRFYEFIYALTNMHFKTQLAPRASKSFFVTVKNH